jgi:hypothetical protein
MSKPTNEAKRVYLLNMISGKFYAEELEILKNIKKNVGERSQVAWVMDDLLRNNFTVENSGYFWNNLNDRHYSGQEINAIYNAVKMIELEAGDVENEKAKGEIKRRATRQVFRLIAQLRNEDDREILTSHITTFLNMANYDNFYAQQLTFSWALDMDKNGSEFYESLRVAWGRSPDRQPNGRFLFS